MKLSKVFIMTGASLLIASCGQSSSKTALNNKPINAGVTTNQPIPNDFKEMKPEEIKRECSGSEAQSFKAYDQLIQNSNTSVEAVKGKKDAQVIKAGVAAIQACDNVIAEIANSGPCRINRVTTNGPTFSPYDGYSVIKKCKITEKYLLAFDVRPSKENAPVSQPPVIQPPVVPIPVVVNPTVPEPVVTVGSLRQCSADEFENLKSSMSSIDLATKQISQQGAGADWKYDSDAISNAALGAKSCEALISLRDQSPCERTVTKADGSKILRQYTGAYLRQRCEMARSYFYEFVQNTTTLNFKNAELYLDVSGFEEKVFDTVPVNVQGCIVENRTDHAVDYSNRSQVLIKDSRGFSNNMMVLETEDGLLVQCYGLKVDGPFSKRQVVRLLKTEGTNMPLSYKMK